MFKQLNSLDFP